MGVNESPNQPRAGEYADDRNECKLTRREYVSALGASVSGMAFGLPLVEEIAEPAHAAEGANAVARCASTAPTTASPSIRVSHCSICCASDLVSPAQRRDVTTASAAPVPFW
jgi:hypothetical protein